MTDDPTLEQPDDGNSLAADVAGAQAVGMATAWLRVEDEEPGDTAPKCVVDELAELHGQPFLWEWR